MIIANGQVDVTTYIVLRDATTRVPKIDVTVTDIDTYYVKDGVAISAKADLTALAAANTAHTDNYGYHVGKGLYRIDWPDAAFNGGIGTKVQLIIECTGVDTCFLEVTLSPSVNVNEWDGDAVIPSASDLLDIFTGVSNIQANTDTIPDVKTETDKLANVSYGLAALAELSTDIGTDVTTLLSYLANGGTIDLLIDAIKAKTDLIPASPAAVGSAMTLTVAYDAAKTAAQAGNQMDLVNAPNATAVTAIQNGLATSSALTTIAGYIDTEITTILGLLDTEIAAILAKTNLIPASPAAVGSAMTLTSAYDAAKTAAQAGNQMDLVNVPNATAVTAIQNGLATSSALSLVAGYIDTEVADILARVDTEIASIKTKTDLIPASPAEVGSAMTLTSAYDAAKTASQAGNQMDLVNAPNATAVTAIQAGLATAANLVLTKAVVDAIKVTTDALPGSVWTNVLADSGGLTAERLITAIVSVLLGAASGAGLVSTYKNLAGTDDVEITYGETNGTRLAVELL